MRGRRQCRRLLLQERLGQLLAVSCSCASKLCAQLNACNALVGTPGLYTVLIGAGMQGLLGTPASPPIAADKSSRIQSNARVSSHMGSPNFWLNRFP